MRTSAPSSGAIAQSTTGGATPSLCDILARDFDPPRFLLLLSVNHWLLTVFPTLVIFIGLTLLIWIVTFISNERSITLPWMFTDFH